VQRIKLPKIVDSITIEIDGVEVFPIDLIGNKVIECRKEKGENPKMIVDLIESQTRGLQVQFRLCGNRKLEELWYHSYNPSKWKSWARIYIPLSKLNKLIDFLLKSKYRCEFDLKTKLSEAGGSGREHTT